MALRETLQRILADYPTAKTQPLENHPLAQFVRGEAETAVQEGLGELAPGLLIVCAIAQSESTVTIGIQTIFVKAARHFSSCSHDGFPA